MSIKKSISKIVVVIVTLAMILSGLIVIFGRNAWNLRISESATESIKKPIDTETIKSLSTKIKTIESLTNPKAVPVGYKLTIKTGLTSYQRLLEVSLDTKTPQYYKVTVMGKPLMYKPKVKLHVGFVDTMDNAAIKNGVKLDLNVGK